MMLHLVLVLAAVLLRLAPVLLQLLSVQELLLLLG
jgi:hypothetical protein